MFNNICTMVLSGNVSLLTSLNLLLMILVCVEWNSQICPFFVNVVCHWECRKKRANMRFFTEKIATRKLRSQFLFATSQSGGGTIFFPFLFLILLFANLISLCVRFGCFEFFVWTILLEFRCSGFQACPSVQNWGLHRKLSSHKILCKIREASTAHTTRNGQIHDKFKTVICLFTTSI